MDYYYPMDFKASGLSDKKQHFLLILGLVLLLGGGGLILATTGLVPVCPAAICTACIVLGFLLILGVYWRKRSSAWFFMGTMLILSGLFSLLIKAAAPGASIQRLWPFYMVFVGLSSLSAGYYKSHRAKAAYIIPSACFILLGCFFLLFSMRVVSLSLRAFMLKLWPFFFISAGAIVLGMYIGNRMRFNKPSDKEE